MVRHLVIAIACVAPGCFTTPPRPGGGGNGVAPNIAFVTSEARSVDAISGLSYADAWCMEAAASAAVPLEGTYKAWLSASHENAKNRFGTARGWVRVDGKPFADSIDDIVTNRRVYYPLRIDENGDDLLALDPFSVTSPVATATNAMGDVAENCNDFTGGGGGIRLGYQDAGGTAWTHGTLRNCDATLLTHIYCLGTDRASQVDPPATPGPRVFVTEEPIGAGVGIAGFDARCASEASTAGLTGEFRAVVSTTTQSAIDRVGGGGTTWNRVDGLATTSDFVSFEAPIVVSARGLYLSRGPVWTGSMDPAMTGTQTCQDWTIDTFDDSGRSGRYERSTPHAFGYTQASCNALEPTRIYCAELP